MEATGANAPDEPESRWAFVCESSSCRYQGSVQTREALVRALAGQRAEQRAASSAGRPEGEPQGQVHVVRSGCLSLCGAGPAVVTYPAGEVHLRVQPEDAADLALTLSGGPGAGQGARRVRAPQWYREHIVARLAYVIQILQRRGAPSAR
jgi:(2Fe-2S) ferredoxin